MKKGQVAGIVVSISTVAIVAYAAFTLSKLFADDDLFFMDFVDED